MGMLAQDSTVTLNVTSIIKSKTRKRVKRLKSAEDSPKWAEAKEQGNSRQSKRRTSDLKLINSVNFSRLRRCPVRLSVDYGP